MRRVFRTAPLVFLAHVSLSASTCAKEGALPVGKAEASKDAGGSGAVLQGIPGMDFSEFPPSAQRELASVLSDEFCYCGCPHPLGACLKSHTSCRHARRMAALAASDVAAGVPAVEASIQLSRYYLSFREPRASFELDGRMCKGPKDAKITLVEFFDFECPYCAEARLLFEAFLKKNEGKVRFCSVPFPLEAHPNAKQAAQAALFARDKDRYWAVHDLLFESQADIGKDGVKRACEAARLSWPEVEKAILAGKYLEELSGFKGAGTKAGVRSTPSVFVNGRKLELGLSEIILQHTVEDELEWSGNGGAWAAD